MEYAIGTTYKHYYYKHKGTYTVVDVFKTYNSKGELVKTEYVTEHDFMGQTLTRSDVSAVEIARSLYAMKEPKK